MNILFLIDRYPGFGGIETVTTVLANYFLKLDYKVAIISRIQENEEILEKLDTQVLLFRFPNKQNKISSENETYLKHVINEFQPNFLINQESYSSLFKLLIDIKNEISCKIITVEHNSPDARYKMLVNYIENEKLEFNIKSILKKLLFPVLFWKCLYRERKYHRQAYKLSDDYILLSKQFIPIFKKIGGFKNIKKIQVIENPITVEPEIVSIENKEKIVLYVGRLDYGHKRVDRLLKIWAKIATKVPDWKLIIIGDGPDRSQLESYVASHNISNIFFKGSQSNVEKYYSKASILCLTSNVEGWGLVLTEAMTFGCVPIVYNSFASASDIIEDKINGRLIEPFNKRNFEEILLDLIQNKSQRDIMGQKAVEDCNRFSIEKIGDKWQKILKI